MNADHLINLAIAMFGSGFGAAVGVYLTYRYLRRTVDDAVTEYREILLNDDMRQILVDAMAQNVAASRELLKL